MEKSLTVYKASAGSGKTFQLALEYIRILIANPESYRQILAVTFTNKATEEMKNRIVSQLYGMSHDLGDPDTQEYIRIITSEMKVTREFVRQRATTALHYLLHNYSYFRVETIDSFFQSVLRNLARELELTANLRIDLNDRQIESQAVDSMIEQLNTTSVELQWILSYIRENIEDDKSWNIIGQLKSFGENIFNDTYKKERENLNLVLHNRHFFQSYVEQLKKIRKEARQQMEKYAERFQQLLTMHGIETSDFSSGERGVSGYFLKLGKGVYDDRVLTETVKKALSDPMKWLKKADQKLGSPLQEAVLNHFQPLLVESETSRPQYLRQYKSADLTLCHMNQLRLLNSIDEQVHEENRLANRFLLSDTQTLLNSLIAENDAPFIFEKTGAQLNHIMIDEFQDTSIVQWENFKVLLKECMSHGHSTNLIVGDVKQSIYRWRSGDWNLLNNIEEQFSSEQLQTIPMETNFRSSKRIVQFNNAFFDTAKKIECDSIAEKNDEGARQLSQAYSDVRQHWRDGLEDDGFVQVELLAEKDYQKCMMEKVKEVISMLLSHQIPEGKIAVLVRSNQTIQDIAQFLMREMPDLKLVSDEAFRLNTSLAVNVLVQAMNGLAHPDDMLVRAFLAKAYRKIASGGGQTEAELHASDLSAWLPPRYVNEADTLRSLPIYDMAEQLSTIFELSRLQEQNAYICSFFDHLGKFLTDNLADIDMFLEAWEENIQFKSIQSNVSDGVRLLTIHKSKGLEFDHVIIPFCDWRLEMQSLMWCRTSGKEAPFNSLPLLPIDFSASKMSGTVYEEEYLHEHLQNMVDNLNLLYVAFTRACSNLFVFGRKVAKGTRSKLIEDAICDTAQALDGAVLEIAEDGDDAEKEKTPVRFTFGQLKTKVRESRESENVFRKKPSSVDVPIASLPFHTKFLQSNQSRLFTHEEEPSGERRESYIEIGNMMHRILSAIHTKADIPQALRQMENEGVVCRHDNMYQRLTRLLQQRLENPRVADWFSGRWELYNECSVIYVDPVSNKTKEKRPDRVMKKGDEVIVVDFKFGTPKPEHVKQVESYLQLLSSMGYPDPKGYLWYFYTNRIEEVTMTPPAND